MKAAIVHEPGGIEALRYEDVPDPPCGPGEVRIRVRASGINRGDLGRRAGTYAGELTYPLIIGWDVAGEVESVGSGVRDRKVGERVVAVIRQGGYAELATAPAVCVVPLPDNVGYDEGASLPIAYLTSRYALIHLCALREGEVALVQARASGVGVAGIQIARNLGATVITTAGSDAKVEFCLGLGAHHAINYTTQDFVREVERITDGRGVDVVLDSVGGETLARCIDVMAPYARLTSVGNSARTPAMVDAITIFTRRLRVEGFGLLAESDADLGRELAELVRQVAEGSLKAVVDRTYPLKDIGEAHRYLEERRNTGKVIAHP